MDLIIISLLVLTSLVGLTFIVERGVALRWHKVVPPTVVEAVASCRSPEDVPMLRRICEQNPSPLSRLLIVAQDHSDWSREDASATLQTRARHEISRLETGLVVLEIVVGVAPLMGLVGTIYGLILLFSGTTTPEGGMADNSKLAGGIAVALHATLLGLITAIPSLVAWNYYSRKIDAMAIELERICDELLRWHYRNQPAHPEVVAAPAVVTRRSSKKAV